jgi:hypothetical protein
MGRRRGNTALVGARRDCAIRRHAAAMLEAPWPKPTPSEKPNVFSFSSSSVANFARSLICDTCYARNSPGLTISDVPVRMSGYISCRSAWHCCRFAAQPHRDVI